MDIKMNENLESPRASKLMIRMVFISALIIIVIGIVYYRSFAALPFALGVIVTSGLNIIKLRMLERTVQKIVNMEDQEAGKNLVRFQYLIRYFITGAVLVAVGLISNYTTEPPFYSSRESYIAVWAVIFPGAPESLKSAPFISIWGALAGVFTLQLSVILVRSMKLEKDGDNFVEYIDDDEIDIDHDNDIDDENEPVSTTDDIIDDNIVPVSTKDNMLDNNIVPVSKTEDIPGDESYMC